MQFKQSKTDKYQWTQHSLMKMQYYGLSEQRVKRVIKSPQRIEAGIVEKTIAVMQPASTRGKRLSTRGGPASLNNKNGKKSWSSEIWAMYKIRGKNNPISSQKQFRIISAWRYPGVSPKRDPIPDEILDEIKNLL